MSDAPPVARGFFTPDLGPSGSVWMARARAEVPGPETDGLPMFIDRLVAWLRGHVEHKKCPVQPAQASDVLDIGQATAGPLCHALAWLCTEGWGVPAETISMRHTDGRHVHGMALVGVERIVVDPSFRLNHGRSLEALQADPDLAHEAEGWNGYNGENTSGFFRGTMNPRVETPRSDWGWVG